MPNNILFVDDDEKLLNVFRRTLPKHFQLDTAIGGAAGLECLQRQGPYALVVSDMRMPEMDGVQFLSRVRELSPDSIRMILTGQADMQDAINAVNDGQIFRFLNKPCTPESLAKALEAGLAQHGLILAERELLEKTLNGSIKVLTDILSLVNSEAFSRADRLKRYVNHLTGQLKLSAPWEFELAAMLSQIGYVTIPPDLVKKSLSGSQLTGEEQAMLSALPGVARDLLLNIPRLEIVGQMIAGQDQPFSAFSSSGQANPAERPRVELGSQLLKVALAYDDCVARRFSPHTLAIESLLQTPELCDPHLVDALRSMDWVSGTIERKSVNIYDLDTAMIFDEDLKTQKGVLLVAKGQSVSTTLIKSLANYVSRDEIAETIFVSVRKPKLVI